MMGTVARRDSLLLAGRQILICQPFLYRLAGSEIVSLELAEVFSGAGAAVTIGSWGSSQIMAEEVDRLDGARLLNLQSDDFREYVSSANVDLAWCHQGLVPPELLRDPRSTRFVFSHLSSFSPFERPFSASIEAALADAVFFVSGEARNEMSNLGVLQQVDKSKQVLFGNPAPDRFHEFQPGATVGSSTNLSSVLVISNHIPSEVKQAIELLRGDGIEVKVLGITQAGVDSHPERVTPELIARFDAVMTIGKSVQYALCMGKPIYCYDYFGGPGWLGETNLSRAQYFNFSGRGFPRRSAQAILDELVGGYREAATFSKENVARARDEFSYARVLTLVADVLVGAPHTRGAIDDATAQGFSDAHAAVRDFGNAYYQLLQQASEEARLTGAHVSNLEASVSVLKAETERAEEQAVLTANHVSNLEATVESLRQTIEQKDAELRVGKVRERLTQQHIGNLEAALRDRT